MNDMKTAVIRAESHFFEDLKEIAKKQGRSVNNLMVWVLSNHIKETKENENEHK